MSVARKYFINAGLLLGSLLVSFLFLEALLRFGFPEKNVLFPRYHSEAHYGDFTIRRLEPDAEFRHTSIDGSWDFVTNNKGFRNHNNTHYKKRNGVIRVLVLGDSHTEGFEVRQESTYSFILEKYLTRRGYDVEVINAGVSGFSTAEELVFLENEGIKYDPDYVVAGFFANDYDDNIKSDLFRYRAGKLKINKKVYIPGVRILAWHNKFGILRWLSERSYLYSFAMNLGWDFFKNSLLQEKSSEMSVFSGSLDRYKLDLAGQLVRRMCQFGRKSAIVTIMIDIPRLSSHAGERYQSSVEPETERTMRENCDAFIGSDAYLERFSGVIDPFVPHGHRHISEFTHTLIGVYLGSKIEAFESQKLKNIKVIQNDKNEAQDPAGSGYM